MDAQEQAIRVSLTAARVTLKALLGAARSVIDSKDQIKHGEQSLKRLNLQNRQMESVQLSGTDIQAFRQALKKYSVDFSVYKENGQYTVYFKSQDNDRVHQGITNALKDYDKLSHGKKPVKEVMDDAVKRAAEREAGRKGQEHEHSASKEAAR